MERSGAHQLFDAFIDEELWEAELNRLHGEDHFAVGDVLQVGQTGAEVIIRLARHVHVLQCEVQPENGEASNTELASVMHKGGGEGQQTATLAVSHIHVDERCAETAETQWQDSQSH